MKDTSYWNGYGRYQEQYAILRKLIPTEGALPNARSKNKALDKLRRAGNCYYDLYNNGLGNRAAEFRQVFGFGGTRIVKNRFKTDPTLEASLDQMILAAYKEQFGFCCSEPGAKVEEQ